MMKVERSIPMYFLPYIDFSPQAPYLSATLWSGSASRVKSSFWLSANLRSASGSSGEIPSTRAPSSRYSSPRSRMPQAWVVQPGVSARG